MQEVQTITMMRVVTIATVVACLAYPTLGYARFQDTFFIQLMILLAVAILAANFALIRLRSVPVRVRGVIVALFPLTIIAFAALRVGSTHAMAATCMAVLICCSISRDNVILLLATIVVDIAFCICPLYTAPLEAKWTLLLFDVLILHVGVVTLYFSNVWENHQTSLLWDKTVEAERATQTKSDFLANMSHEIRTPMNAILGYCTFMLRDPLSVSDRNHVLGIRTASQSLLSIINDILDFSKIESGKIEIIPTTYELASLVNDTISTIGVRVARKPINLFVDIDPNLPSHLIGDEVRIRQVITNLLSNAVKFTNHGFVRLSMKGVRSNGRLLFYVSVQDTGIGIRDEDLEKLFGSFQQVDTHKNREVEGTGLGLVISRSFVELMGGVVSLETEYGKGSTFTFMVPQSIPSTAKPFVSVAIPSETRVAVLEPYPDEARNWASTLESLGVPYRIVAGFADFLPLVRGGAYSHYFIDEDIYTKLASDIVVDKGNVVVVLNQDMRVKNADQILTIRRPIYSLTLALVLSDLPYYEFVSRNRGQFGNFTAPKARVLIVDDNDVNLKIASGLLSPYEMDVRCASSGREALDQIKTDFLDLVLMDHMMPDLDGVDTVKMVRELTGEYYANLPIVATTANAIIGVREMYLNEGFSDYIAKPLEPSKLEQILKTWVPKTKQIPKTSSSDHKKMEDSGIVLPSHGVQVSPESETLALEPIMVPSQKTQLIDIQKGLIFSGGNEVGYADVLHVCLTAGDKNIAKIRRYVAEQNWRLFTIEVHALKSIAKGIGAMPLSEGSHQMESAGKRQDSKYITENISQYWMLFDATMRRIHELLETELRFKPPADLPGGEWSPQESVQLKTVLLDALAALESYDAAHAARCLQKLNAREWEQEIADAIRAISGFVDQYDYDQGIAAIKNLLNEDVSPFGGRQNE